MEQPSGAKKRPGSPTAHDPDKRQRTDAELFQNLVNKEAGIQASAGSMRPAVASKHWVLNFPIDDILSRGNWRSQNTFSKFYQREIRSSAQIGTTSNLFQAI